MNTIVSKHLESAHNILELIFSEYFDQPESDGADLNPERKLLEFLLYRATDHIVDAKKAANSSDVA